MSLIQYRNNRADCKHRWLDVYRAIIPYSYCPDCGITWNEYEREQKEPINIEEGEK